MSAAAANQGQVIVAALVGMLVGLLVAAAAAWAIAWRKFQMGDGEFLCWICAVAAAAFGLAYVFATLVMGG